MVCISCLKVEHGNCSKVQCGRSHGCARLLYLAVRSNMYAKSLRTIEKTMKQTLKLHCTLMSPVYLARP